MEIIGTDDVETVEAVDGVHLSLLAAGEEMSVQGFVVEPGATVPLHSHPHEQTGYVVEGALTFVDEDGGESVVEPGDSYAISGDEPHAAENRGDVPVRGIDVFSPPRTDPDWAE